MTYYLRRFPGSHYQTLVETSPRHAETADISKVNYHRVDPTYARQWVKNGGHHETPLWVDWDGKVRYARDAR